MAKTSDAIGAILLAAVGVLILVAWQRGFFRELLGQRSENTERQRGVDARDAVSRLPTTGGAPRVSGGGFGAVARGGVPDNGFTPTTGALAATAEFFGRAPITMLPNAAELIPETRAQEIRENSRKLTPAELSPVSLRGQEIRENTRTLRPDELADPAMHSSDAALFAP